LIGGGQDLISDPLDVCPNARVRSRTATQHHWRNGLSTIDNWLVDRP